MASFNLPRRTILNKTNVRNAIILSPLLIFVALFNRHIFVESYLSYFSLCIFVFLIFKNHYKLKSAMFINRIVISIFVFLIYALFRIDIDFFVIEMNKNSDDFFDDFSNYFLLNIVFFGAILSFNRKNPSEIIWLAVTYIFLCIF